MVLLTITSNIIRAVNQLESSGKIADILDGPLQDDPVVGKPISHTQVLAISKALKQHYESLEQEYAESPASYFLDDLLRGSHVYIEPPKAKDEPTSEYKALMARLRREEEDRAYERMINPPPATETFGQRFPNSAHANLFPTRQEDTGDEDSISYEDINRQMALIINILVSIVACSVAIWLAARHWSTPSRLGLSLGGSGAVAIAEAVVYAGYLRRLKEAREKGRKEVEVKEIIKSWVIGTGAEEISLKDINIDSPKEAHDESMRKRK